MGCWYCWPLTKLPLSATAVFVIVGLNREDASGQSTDETMQRYVMLLRVLDSAVTAHVVAPCRRLAVYRGHFRWHPVTVLAIIILIIVL